MLIKSRLVLSGWGEMGELFCFVFSLNKLNFLKKENVMRKHVNIINRSREKTHNHKKMMKKAFHKIQHSFMT